MAQAIRKLPRQPIPPLSETVDACVHSVSPMLNTLQRLKSKLVFDLYGASQGKRQQRLLTLAGNQSVNWGAEGLAQIWLSCRHGLPFSNNYVLLLEDDPRAASHSERAARLIAAALYLHQSVRGHGLSPDVAAELPLEMDQYQRCFATHRLPRLQCDEVVTVAGSRHIAVLVDGQVHSLAVEPQRGPAWYSSLKTALDNIVENADAATANDNISTPAMLSALPRDQWAKQRGELLKDSQNRQTLEILESALFVVCLDTDAAPGSLSGLSAVMRDGNSHNRFYDKSMQIIVMENGTAGLCFERAAVDGSVALGFAARLQRESLNLPACGAEAAQQQSAVRIRAADWSLSAALKRRLQAAKKYIAAARAQRGIEAWTAPHFGTRRLKELDISPDAVVQLAIQLAAREVTGRMPTVFEPVQIRHFAGGRMDFIVPVTAESLEAVRSLRTANANQYFAAVQIRRAAKAHQNLVLHTKSGRGLIAHLLALNAIQADDAARNGDKAHFGRHALWPRLDKGLQVLIRQDVLAANGSGFTGVASFGPIGPRPNMLSIGYLINEDAITFELRADGRYSGQARALRTALDKALLTIEKLLASCKQGELR